MRKSDTRCESKQECSSSNADELKVEFSAEWLRIWRYERGISFKTPLNNECSRFLMMSITVITGSTVRAPVFDRHQFFGTSEHYGKAHGSLLSGWMNYNYTACCWFSTSSKYFNTSITALKNQVWKLLIALFKVPNTGALTVLTHKPMCSWQTHKQLSDTWMWGSANWMEKSLINFSYLHPHST